MPRNVAIKAYIESIDLLARKTAAIADKGAIEIDQTAHSYIAKREG